MKLQIKSLKYLPSYFKQTISKFAQTIDSSLVLSLISLILSALAYYQTEVHSKQTFSINFIERFSENRIYSAYERVHRKWSEDKDLRIKTISNFQDLNRGYQCYTLEFVERANLKEDLIALANFFEAVSICANQKVCDPELLQAYFSKYLKSYLTNYAEFVASIDSDKKIRAEFQNFLGEAYIELKDQGAKDICNSCPI